MGDKKLDYNAIKTFPEEKKKRKFQKFLTCPTHFFVVFVFLSKKKKFMAYQSKRILYRQEFSFELSMNLKVFLFFYFGQNTKKLVSTK